MHKLCLFDILSSSLTKKGRRIIRIICGLFWKHFLFIRNEINSKVQNSLSVVNCILGYDIVQILLSHWIHQINMILYFILKWNFCIFVFWRHYGTTIYIKFEEGEIIKGKGPGKMHPNYRGESNLSIHYNLNNNEKLKEGVESPAKMICAISYFRFVKEL